ncbi:MAG: RAMP superfamily CRISPR-associated protein [Coleofasciculaceae cyanobacterium]
MIQLDTLLSNRVETIHLTVVIDTALCVGAGGSSGSLADKPIVRNAKGQLLIPASQLKGRLRHECEKIARGLGWQIFESPGAETLCPTENQVEQQFREIYQIDGYRGYHCLVSQIFGNPILPSRIIVDDLICPLEVEDLSEVLRPGVTINRTRGTAEEKKLYFLETSPANAQLQFEGAIHLQPSCPPYAKPLILAGLHHIHALGGSKSAGLGWLTWKGLEKIAQDNPVWLSLLPGETP